MVVRRAPDVLVAQRPVADRDRRDQPHLLQPLQRAIDRRDVDIGIMGQHRCANLVRGQVPPALLDHIQHHQPLWSQAVALLSQHQSIFAVVHLDPRAPECREWSRLLACACHNGTHRPFPFASIAWGPSVYHGAARPVARQAACHQSVAAPGLPVYPLTPQAHSGAPDDPSAPRQGAPPSRRVRAPAAPGCSTRAALARRRCRRRPAGGRCVRVSP